MGSPPICSFYGRRKPGLAAGAAHTRGCNLPRLAEPSQPLAAPFARLSGYNPYIQKCWARRDVQTAQDYWMHVRRAAE